MSGRAQAAVEDALDAAPPLRVTGFGPDDCDNTGTGETGEHPAPRWCLMGLVAFHFLATCACHASGNGRRTPGFR